jgi:DNA-binding transcriptional ArsR family regulator
MNQEELVARARVLKALASPVRLKIVDELSRGERCICELQPLFSMNKSTLSRHVAELRNVGIVAERREGVKCFLRLQTPCVLNLFDCVMGVIRAEARRQVAVACGGKAAQHPWSSRPASGCTGHSIATGCVKRSQRLTKNSRRLV